MKVAGKSLVDRNVAVVAIKRGEEQFELKLTSLPFGWHGTVVNCRMPQPVPPKVISRGANGKVVKMASGKLQTEEDYNDPVYLEKQSLWERRYQALAVCELLRDDETVVWDAQPPQAGAKKEDWETFADGIIGELNSAGFTDTDIEMLLAAGQAISGSVNTDEAIKRFLSNRDSEEEETEA